MLVDEYEQVPADLYARLLRVVPIGLATEGSFCVHGTVRRRVPVVSRLVTFTVASVMALA
jgi:hypothetical protein